MWNTPQVTHYALVRAHTQRRGRSRCEASSAQEKPSKAHQQGATIKFMFIQFFSERTNDFLCRFLGSGTHRRTNLFLEKKIIMNKWRKKNREHDLHFNICWNINSCKMFRVRCFLPYHFQRSSTCVGPVAAKNASFYLSLTLTNQTQRGMWTKPNNKFKVIVMVQSAHNSVRCTLYMKLNEAYAKQQQHQQPYRKYTETENVFFYVVSLLTVVGPIVGRMVTHRKCKFGKHM